MKTKATISIDDQVMRRVKAKAAREGRTMSDLIEQTLREMLDERPRKPTKLRPLPSWDMGPARVDIADREALYEFLDEHD